MTIVINNDELIIIVNGNDEIAITKKSRKCLLSQSHPAGRPLLQELLHDRWRSLPNGKVNLSSIGEVMNHCCIDDKIEMRRLRMMTMTMTMTSEWEGDVVIKWMMQVVLMMSSTGSSSAQLQSR